MGAIGGAHAQMASSAELSLGARIDGLRPEDVRAAITERRTLVKTWAMRGTLHLIAASELPLVVAALRSRLRYDKAFWLRAFGVTLAEMEALFRAIPAALDGRGLTREELADEMGRRVAPRFAELLRSGWGSLLKPAAFQGLLAFGPSRGQRVTFVRPDQWVAGWSASELAPEEAVGELARRYLHAYGPAPHAEFARWFGVDPPVGRRAIRSIEGDLAEVTVDERRAWVLAADVEAIVRSEPIGAGCPHVRLLPNFDPYTLFSWPREHLVPDAYRSRVYRKSAWISPVLLLDGVVAGVWGSTIRRGRLELRIELFRELDGRQRAALEVEAQAVGGFLGAPVDLLVAGVGEIPDGY